MSHKMWVWLMIGLLSLCNSFQAWEINSLSDQLTKWQTATAGWVKEIERIDTEVRALNGLSPLKVTVLDDGGAHLKVESRVVPVK